MKNSTTLALLMLSFGLVGTWAFHLYDKTVYSNRKTVVFIKDTVAIKRSIRDSLRKVYAATITQLPPNLDSLQRDLSTTSDNETGEIYSLDREISEILRKNNLPEGDLLLARQKIGQLQQKVVAYRSQNCDIKDEMKKLNAVLERLTTDMRGLERNLQRLDLKK